MSADMVATAKFSKLSSEDGDNLSMVSTDGGSPSDSPTLTYRSPPGSTSPSLDRLSWADVSEVSSGEEEEEAQTPEGFLKQMEAPAEELEAWWNSLTFVCKVGTNWWMGKDYLGTCYVLPTQASFGATLPTELQVLRPVDRMILLTIACNWLGSAPGIDEEAPAYQEGQFQGVWVSSSMKVAEVRDALLKTYFQTKQASIEDSMPRPDLVAKISFLAKGEASRGAAKEIIVPVGPDLSDEATLGDLYQVRNWYDEESGKVMELVGASTGELVLGFSKVHSYELEWDKSREHMVGTGNGCFCQKPKKQQGCETFCSGYGSNKSKCDSDSCYCSDNMCNYATCELCHCELCWKPHEKYQKSRGAKGQSKGQKKQTETKKDSVRTRVVLLAQKALIGWF